MALVLDSDVHPIYAVVARILTEKGYRPSGAGKSMSVSLGSDWHIESFIYRASDIKMLSGRRYESLGYYMSGHAFSIELRIGLNTFTPMYGEIPNFEDPVSFAKAFFLLLQDLMDAMPKTKALPSSLGGVLMPREAIPLLVN